MEAREYEKMAEVEDRMWWYKALHRNLLGLIERFLDAPAARLLDAGCGTGGLLRVLDTPTPTIGWSDSTRGNRRAP